MIAPKIRCSSSGKFAPLASLVHSHFAIPKQVLTTGTGPVWVIPPAVTLNPVSAYAGVFRVRAAFWNPTIASYIVASVSTRFTTGADGVLIHDSLTEDAGVVEVAGKTVFAAQVIMSPTPVCGVTLGFLQGSGADGWFKADLTLGELYELA